MHFSFQNIIFLLVAVAGFGLFIWQAQKIRANILVGRDRDMSGNVNERLWKTLLVAFGQQKMFKRLTPAFLHLIVYVGFIVINIEVIEILIDGIFGTHRVLGFMGPLYSALTGTNEVLGALVILAVAAFWWRRNGSVVRRFTGPEMRAWPRMDANVILYIEVILMVALFMMNTADLKMHQLEGKDLPGAFPVSSLLTGLFPDSVTALHVLERVGWWAHIVGILLFLNYLPSSKHFHIIMAFPNVYFSRLMPQGQFSNVDSITHEVKAMMDPTYQVPTPPVSEGAEAAPTSFGAKDVNDLAWTNLLNAYSCTECGRCTSVCPANLTGKLLSPRKIIMDTRDRMEEKYNSPLIFNPNLYGKEAKHDPQEQLDKENHTLLRGYVTPEELWACTTCNACVEACPVNINPLESIIEMRRFLVLEESAAPNSLNVMFSNIENNGAPWAFSPSDRFNWADELYVTDKAGATA
ncbi:4Fe-4S dicluster domain-containing protein [Hymenobacter sediminicola]|uniref:4Fe-4S dicluster domain-containing protein n=1 Tax=Hymenobacter sediminicola TaxID=2761579 RepID=UPI0021AFAC9F|nr:4Fe-4S dicluster domain-containing protein [Hymenobacter sediminicola]